MGCSQVVKQRRQALQKRLPVGIGKIINENGGLMREIGRRLRAREFG
jgi:hypothetical protein